MAGEIDPEAEWKEKWAPILMKEGEIDLAQLKKELADFSLMIREVPAVYCEITGGRLSYPTYAAKTVIGVYHDHLEELEEMQRADDKEDGECSRCGQELKNEERERAD